MEENPGIAWGVAFGLLAGGALAVLSGNWWLFPGLGLLAGLLIGMMVDRRGSA
ncbi:hypothetical protein GCM10009613_64130 [Pseudonocardia kongjuensis]|uniref:Glycine zipper family protein n=1 Tax=Pseudonocardia kongjuensis TaxID=102227 RepID=A0ABP4J4W7_9PSEU